MTVDQLKEVLDAWEQGNIAKAMDIFDKYNKDEEDSSDSTGNI